jgi:hypothetical protein
MGGLPRGADVKQHIIARRCEILVRGRPDVNLSVSRTVPQFNQPFAAIERVGYRSQLDQHQGIA